MCVRRNERVSETRENCHARYEREKVYCVEMRGQWCVCVRERERERERERLCVSPMSQKVCERERDVCVRESQKDVCGNEGESVCVCVRDVCVREREREWSEGSAVWKRGAVVTEVMFLLWQYSAGDASMGSISPWCKR